MREGLYSVHVQLGDGRPEKGSGVLLFRGGRILGGDAFLLYVGTYSASDGRLHGEVVVNQHTPSPDARPLFGGREVGIGFTGEFADGRGDLVGTALVGRESLWFRATLRHLAGDG